MSVQLKQISYQKWLEHNPSVKTDYPCDTCGGTGVETCPCCGGECSCSRCDGDGHMARAAYRAMCKRDIEMAERAGCLQVIMPPREW